MCGILTKLSRDATAHGFSKYRIYAIPLDTMSNNSIGDKFPKMMFNVFYLTLTVPASHIDNSI